MTTEQEARFYFPDSQRSMLIEKITSNWEYSHSYHEVTTMYDNPNPDLSFYKPEVDGRLRVRISKQVKDEELGASKNQNGSACLITWKRRIPEQQNDGIRREEEIEHSVHPDEAENAVGIYEKVLKCPRLSSYERTRHFFNGESLQITLDEFPFGLMLEFELKGTEDDSILNNAMKRFELAGEQASDLSCDDKYQELCESSGIKPKSDIAFSDPTMPKI